MGTKKCSPSNLPGVFYLLSLLPLDKKYGEKNISTTCLLQVAQQVSSCPVGRRKCYTQ